MLTSATKFTPSGIAPGGNIASAGIAICIAGSSAAQFIFGVCPTASTGAQPCPKQGRGNVAPLLALAADFRCAVWGTGLKGTPALPVAFDATGDESIFE